MKGYEFIAKTWKDYGTTHVFYQELMFMKTLKEFENLGGKTILAHSEFAAGYMADGYARVTGRPGVALAQSIGSANLAASIHDAWLGCSPVLTFTGRQSLDKLYRNAYQESDHRPFFDGLTKFNATVERAHQLPLLMRQSYRAATTGKPRPTHLDIFGFFGMECEDDEVNEDVLVNAQFAKYPAFRPAAEESAIDQAVEAIEKAKKPLIMVGRGGIVSGAQKELYTFAQRNDIPVCTSPDGKTMIDEDDPLWAGVIGNYGMYGTNRIAADCDLFIIVGSQTGDQTTLNLTAPPPSVKAIQIDIEPSEIGRNYPNCIPLCGDAKVVLGQLAAAVPSARRTEWRIQVAAWLKETTDAHEALWNNSSDPITTGYICKQVTDALPDNAVLVGDTGWPCVWSATMIRVKASQFYTRAAGSLGWSFPAALGIKCGAPDRPVINFIGDGGMFYFSNEIETAVRYNIPIVSVIYNNRSLAQVIPFMSGIYSGEENRCVDRLSFRNDFSYARIAQEFGAHGVQVTKAADVAGAIRDAIASNRPAIVEVMSERCAPLGPRSNTL